MRRLVWPIFFLLAGVAPAWAAATNPLGSYDFYPTAVEGSARYVGLGGSVVALPKDYTAVFINPAGLGGLADDGVDFGSDSNNIDNVLIDPTNPKQKALNDPLKFSFYGARYVSADGWGFGVAAHAPYKLDDKFSGTTKVSHSVGPPAVGQDQSELQAASNIYTFGGAKSFLDKRLSIGLAVNYIQVSEQYDFNPVFTTTAPVHVRATSDAMAADLGFIYRPWQTFRVGGVYSMGWRAPFDPTRNSGALGTLGPVAAFRDGKSPDKVSLGVAWNPNRYWGVFAQSNFVIAMRDTKVVGSGFFPNSTENLGIGQSDTIDGHWGIEFVPFDESDLTVKFWAGGYLEEAGVSGGYNRYHRTAGFAVEPWFLSLSMAIDDTENFNNFTVGLGVDLLQVSARIAKKLGYKLPI